MQSLTKTPEDYVAEAPIERQAALQKLRELIKKNIPKGFEEMMGYGMIGYSVPHSIYPDGYHCDPKQALPFVSFASQKNFIALYHMGIYAKPELLDWFTSEFPKHSKKKLDMGKSCIRFKKPEDIPFDLIGELMQKITVDEWINIYESNWKPKK
jgi:uncharacterized protein YdhG (YjbR/CyaY superfamily)